MSRRRIDWPRVGVTTLRIVLSLTGWLLTHGGQLLQRSGTALLGWAEGLRPK